MPALLKYLYYKIEGIKGKKLAVLIFLIFLIFIPVGILVGNNIPTLLNNSENQPVNQEVPVETVEASSYTGKVMYVDPQLYPNDRISYSLVDSSNTEIILLKATDQKLAVVEGLTVVVFGEVQKTSDDTKDVLLVEKVVVKN